MQDCNLVLYNSNISTQGMTTSSKVVHPLCTCLPGSKAPCEGIEAVLAAQDIM